MSAGLGQLDATSDHELVDGRHLPNRWACGRKSPGAISSPLGPIIRTSSSSSASCPVRASTIGWENTTRFPSLTERDMNSSNSRLSRNARSTPTRSVTSLPTAPMPNVLPSLSFMGNSWISIVLGSSPVNHSCSNLPSPPPNTVTSASPHFAHQLRILNQLIDIPANDLARISGTDKGHRILGSQIRSRAGGFVLQSHSEHLSRPIGIAPRFPAVVVPSVRRSRTTPNRRRRSPSRPTPSTPSFRPHLAVSAAHGTQQSGPGQRPAHRPIGPIPPGPGGPKARRPDCGRGGEHSRSQKPAAPRTRRSRLPHPLTARKQQQKVRRTSKKRSRPTTRLQQP